ncbi:MAG: non-homologous end joining protein Ku [Planctomycetota bacterium]|jgi:DNA end-binding protein Ku
MPPRAIWKGHLRLSLVTIGVRLHNATSSASRISFNQLHKECHHRLRQQMICPEHGPVDRSEIVKGYEYEKGRYVIVEQSDIDAVKLETTKVIEITQFVDPGELNPIFFGSPYYLAPDGKVNEEAFRVMREAMTHTGKVGIGRLVLAGREHIIALRVEGRGFVLTTLRSDEEVRGAEPYFEDIEDGQVDETKLKLAEQLIGMSESPLDTSQFKDRYQQALLEIIKTRLEGEEPAVAEEAEVGPSLNFMDALKSSLEASETRKKVSRKKPPARSKSAAARKKKKKKA